MKSIRCIVLLCLAIIFLAVTPGFGQDKTVIGWIEKVSVHPGSLVLHAKVDTAADHSSLHVTDIEPIIRNGERRVRFSVMNREGKSALLECRVVREAKIKRKGLEPKERYVVKMGICLGTVFKEAQVNLEDRTGFRYHMLIGRSFLRKRFVVDPSLKYTKEPTCKLD